jgi:hypothetical protein
MRRPGTRLILLRFYCMIARFSRRTRFNAWPDQESQSMERMFIFMMMAWLAAMDVAHAQVPVSPTSSTTGFAASATVGPTQTGTGYNGPGGNALVVIKRVGRGCHRSNAWRELRSIECAHLDPPEREFSGRIYDGISRVCYRFCLDQSSDGAAIAGRGHQQHNGIAGYNSGIPGQRPIRHALRSRNIFNFGDCKPRQSVRSDVVQRVLIEHLTAIDPQRRPIRGYPGTPADHYG